MDILVYFSYSNPGIKHMGVVMSHTETYGPIFACVIDWATSENLSWKYVSTTNSILVAARVNGIGYLVTMNTAEEDILTMYISTVVVAINNELEVRRSIERALEHIHIGWFILQFELLRVLWRDQVYFDPNEEYETGLVDELFICGVESIESLRLQCPSIFGITSTNEKLAHMAVQGRA